MRATEITTEAPIPPDWDAEQVQIGKGTSFKSRIDYAKSQARRLGTGSSRVAFVIPFEGRDTVLKVAKNRKGLAQNNEEVSILNDWYLSRLPIVIPLIDFDGDSGEDVSWLHTEMAQPVKNETQLKQWFGTRLAMLIKYSGALIGRHDRTIYKTAYDQEEAIKRFMVQDGATEEQIDRMTECAEHIAELVGNTSLDSADFAWYKNWGWYQGRPVIIDLGYAGSAIPLYRGQR